ncbi:MAG: diguanylate cyclase domain-containing protein [Halothiobacillaceae bacterium]
MQEQELRRNKQRIVSLAVISILITGTLVALGTVYPMYLSLRDSILDATQAAVSAQARALDNQLTRYTDLAEQFTSRTEIRRRLADYERGALDRDALVAFTTPRLRDPFERVPDMVGMQRLDAEGVAVTRLGDPPDHRAAPAEFDVPQLIPVLHEHPDSGAEEVLLLAGAPIFDEAGQRLGTDLLYFQARPLLDAMRQFENRMGEGCLGLLVSDRDMMLFLDRRGERLRPEPLDGVRLPHDLEQAGIMIAPCNVSARTQVTVHEPLAPAAWSLFYQVPANDLYRPAYRELGIAAGLVLLMMLVGAWLTRRLLSPLMDHVLAQASALERTSSELSIAASVFENTREAIITTNTDFVIERINPAFTRILGFNHDDVHGRPLFDLMAEDTRNSASSARGSRIRHALSEQGHWQGEIGYRTVDGRTLPALQTVSVVRDADQRVIRLIHIFNDISQQKANERRIRRLAHHDTLTGLRNRNAILEQLEKRVTQASRKNGDLSVLFLDLDHFKPVNDELGHHIGDQLLQHVAQRLEHVVREQDLVGRLGGDEFLVLLEDIHELENLNALAAKIVETIAAPYRINGNDIQIGTSVGVARYPEDGRDGETLVRHADAAMYAAKQGGRNRHCLYADIQDGNTRDG